MIYIKLLCVAFIVERTVEILVDSKLFAPLRSYIANKAIPNLDNNYGYTSNFWWFVHSLSSCGYCLSVWAGAFYALFYSIKLVEIGIVNWFFNALLLHGLSNLIHIIFMIIYRGRVNYHHITYSKSNENGL